MTIIGRIGTFMAYSKEDWAAVMDSEVMRTYLAAEMRKEAQQTPEPEVANEAQVLEEFAEFEKKVLASPKMKTTFRALQKKFLTDPNYTAKVDPKFVQGVMMLNLSGTQE